MASKVDQFRAQYRCTPTLRIEAPGRGNLIGEHIDYLDGHVMPAAIEPRITFLVAPDPSTDRIELWSAEQGDTRHEVSTADLSPRTLPEEKWLN